MKADKNDITVEDILHRLMETSGLRSLQEVASAIGVSANSMSGWKVRNSVGAAFENIYPYLLQNDISFYYVFFGIGRKDIKISETIDEKSLEQRVARIEAALTAQQPLRSKP